jgi:hypothetical protein
MDHQKREAQRAETACGITEASGEVMLRRGPAKECCGLWKLKTVKKCILPEVSGRKAALCLL